MIGLSHALTFCMTISSRMTSFSVVSSCCLSLLTSAAAEVFIISSSWRCEAFRFSIDFCTLSMLPALSSSPCLMT